MGRFKILIYAVVLFFVLITDSVTVGQWQPPVVASRPLCATQITLANYACATLPYSVLPPPPPPSTPVSGNNESQSSRHSHRHHHRHHHHGIALSPIEENCCKWVQQMDNECACGLLTGLPVFLEKPQHNFSVLIGGSCEATYFCGGATKI